MESKEVKLYIVITSIFDPTEAVKLFSGLSDYKVVVVGDKKTPHGWSWANVTYLPVETQPGVGRHLNKILPFNHYCRKMLGYLFAISDNAEYIIDTDDDNIPKEGWSFPGFDGEFSVTPDKQGYINVYQLFTKQHIWPRGLPLDLINKDFLPGIDLKVSNCRVGVWQGLADEDPDVDAIYRLTSDKPCFFDKREPVVLGEGTLSPFNTQNTIIRKELFPLLYLPTFVTFRFTDILRGLIAQPIMWLHGYNLGFTAASVVQKRNPHDYMKDFLSELPMYEYAARIPGIVQDSINVNCDIGSNLFRAYSALLKEGIVTSRELGTLEAWLKDLEYLSSI
jgi:hypothetical protein